MNINDSTDKPIALRPVPKWLQFIASKHLKTLLRSFVERAKERGLIDSWSYHELHALVERLFP